mmetsp:Transcript_38884/g.116924  ORF Transcript_38884/g.116924 Transcript_38884/m.116924 type:complete len:164 (-) Transcript_38884:514-1005(-)
MDEMKEMMRQIIPRMVKEKDKRTMMGVLLEEIIKEMIKGIKVMVTVVLELNKLWQDIKEVWEDTAQEADKERVENAMEARWFHHNGGMRRFPDDFKFPGFTIPQEYCMWHHSHDDLKIGPLKFVTKEDVRYCRKGTPKNWEDVDCLMGNIDEEVDQRGLKEKK